MLTAPRTAESWNIDGIRDRVAWLEGTAGPGEGGNTVIAGHVTVLNIGKGPFHDLQHLREGDWIRLYRGDWVYVYAVSELRVVKVNDMTITAQDHPDRLTLFTCTGWDEQSEAYQARRVALADLFKIEPFAEQDLPVE